MKLTDYYSFKKLGLTKSKTRYDCVTCTGEYEPLEKIRNVKKQLFVYCNKVPDTFNVEARRKATYAITHTVNISSVYITDLEQPQKGCGDMKGTDDGLLFLFSPDMAEMEVFVARGYKHCINELSNLYLDGELDDEMQALRERVKQTM